MTHPTRAAMPALQSVAVDGMATTAQLRAAGLSERTIARRCRPGGPWQRLLPSVVLLGAGEPTRRQLLRASVGHFGDRTVITGADALAAQGLDLPPPRSVHVLVPVTRRVLPPESIVLERTARPPEPVLVDGLPFAPVERAALDAARREPDPDRLYRLLTLPVYHGLCTPDQLRWELDEGNQRGSAVVRDMLRRIEATKSIFMHGHAKKLATRLPLPPPRWDVTVCDLQERPIGLVDAWWDDVGLGWQFGTPMRGAGYLGHLALTAAGVTLVRTATGRLRSDPDTVLRELVGAFRTASRRPRPNVIVFGAVTAA